MLNGLEVGAKDGVFDEIDNGIDKRMTKGADEGIFNEIVLGINHDDIDNINKGFIKINSTEVGCNEGGEVGAGV